MAAVDTAPGLPGAHHKDASDVSLSTLPDPRTSSSTDLSRTNSGSPRHPDLSNEVAALSDKLINAINHQTTLDDTLAHTRHELEASRARIQQLEAEATEHNEKLSSGVLVRKTDADNDKIKLMTDLAEMRQQKSLAQKGKRDMEQEVEQLTATLFEEANQMVAAARRDREAMERKNQQLQDQMKNTETLLASQQEQLTELKAVMQSMGSDRDEVESHANDSTAPSSPALHREDAVNRLIEAMNLSENSPDIGEISPAPSTTFTHLMRAVCRTDLQAYDDFHSLLQMSAKSQPPSRVTSGTYAGLNVMGLGHLTNHNQVQHLPSNGSTTSLSTPVTGNNTPNLTESRSASGGTPKEIDSKFTPLKETKFYKRALTEDIEPTLRLDLAPGISWLTRRTVLNSICDGNLVVEPMPESSKKLYGMVYSCSICGETRKGEHNPRTHRFRTSDNENAQRYPLCVLCLEKLRATCDFVSYLRMIKDGVLRLGDSEAEKEAWEETVRLRERMFWARVGGGVVPAFIGYRSEKSSPILKRSANGDSPRLSQDAATAAAAILGNGAAVTKPSPLTRESSSGSVQTDDEAAIQVKKNLRDSVQSTTSMSSPPERAVTSSRNSKSGESLKVAIPGSFE